MIGIKVGMTQVYDSEGKIAPVTVLELGPCPVLQIRSLEKEMREAAKQLKFEKAAELRDRIKTLKEAQLEIK